MSIGKSEDLKEMGADEPRIKAVLILGSSASYLELLDGDFKPGSALPFPEFTLFSRSG